MSAVKRLGEYFPWTGEHWGATFMVIRWHLILKYGHLLWALHFFYWVCFLWPQAMWSASTLSCVRFPFCKACRNFRGPCRTGAARSCASSYLWPLSMLASVSGSHDTVNTALSRGWGFPRPVAAPTQWVSRSLWDLESIVHNLCNIYFSVSNALFSHAPPSACNLFVVSKKELGGERKYAPSLLLIFSLKSTRLKGADSSSLTIQSGLTLPTQTV